MEWDLPQLRALAAIADHGTLEAAARHLHVTPSAVSQRLKALEHSVGAILLQRTRPARPTEKGRGVLLLARQMDALTADATAALDASPDQMPEVRLAVNADSLATWVLPALSTVAATVRLTFLREDEEHTAELLRDGTAMAAVTSQHMPVQGCAVEPLGAMRYRPIASPAFVDRWFSDGITPDTLRRAPVIVFDERNRLQTNRLLDAGVPWGETPWHTVPASSQFSEAVRHGYGWGMLPELEERSWEGIDLSAVPGSCLAKHDVKLYWQRWTLQTSSLNAVDNAIRSGASRALL